MNNTHVYFAIIRLLSAFRYYFTNALLIFIYLKHLLRLRLTYAFRVRVARIAVTDAK